MTYPKPLLPDIAYTSVLLKSGSKMDIRYGVWGDVLDAKDHHKPIIVILPGLSEFIEKYAIMVAPLIAAGHDAIVLDWPSQGLSGRFLKDRTIIHSDRFDDHLNALMAVLEAAGITSGRPHKRRLILFGHSMGGHLAFRAAALLRPRVEAMIVSAPMMLPPLTPPWLIRAKLWALMRCGYARKSVSGKSDHSHRYVFDADNYLTRDEEGYHLLTRLWEDNMDLKTYDLTYGWLAAAYRSCVSTTAKASWLKRFDVPVLAHIGSDERLVSADYQKWALSLLPHGEVMTYEGARHELMLELPEVRQAFWQSTLAFIDRVSQHKAASE